MTKKFNQLAQAEYSDDDQNSNGAICLIAERHLLKVTIN